VIGFCNSTSQSKIVYLPLQNCSTIAEEERLPNLIFFIKRVIKAIDELHGSFAVLVMLKGKRLENLLDPNLGHGFSAVEAFLTQRRSLISFY
jgi:hypothetical protein